MMSSMMSRTTFRTLLSSAVLAPVLCVNIGHAQTTTVALARPNTAMTAAIIRPDSSIAASVAQWSSLRQSESMPFSSYANFMVTNPGWPGESVMRKVAERSLRAGGESSRTVIAFFSKFQPQSATGWLRYAEALSTEGKSDDAKTAARNAWVSGALTPDDETRFLSQFGASLTTLDQDTRMDRLLWSRSLTAAGRQIGLTSATRRPLFAARLAMLSKSPDAAAKAATVDTELKNDPGFVADRAFWMRSTGQAMALRSFLAAPRILSRPPTNPQTWLDMLLMNAKDASTDGQYKIAYEIARQATDAYPSGVLVRDRSLAERDVYTDLIWLAGMTALNKLGRPADAAPMFERYTAAAKSPQTRAKGLYWAGRAAEAAGQLPQSNAFYEQAAQYFDQFHGQLATERLGRRLTNLSTPRTIEVSASERDAFNQRGIIRAAIYLGQIGKWEDQSLFVRTIANSMSSDVDHVLATELAGRINRLDLGVMVGRNARAAGLNDYVVSSFPQISVPNDHAGSWTMIHAISRQESQFDRQATSRVGAKGLMQLMPGTARETAPRAGLPYNYGSLSDPSYNVSLGSTYFGELMDQFGGNYVLAVAAYNAGPGNVNKWLRANGDPRNGMDVMAWIEAIPLSETRNYVQRVLENAVVYDLLNPSRAAVKTTTPLSTYLGKRQPG
jgi:soluble lytic murein transglycosylase